jgi:hypothetical protein
MKKHTIIVLLGCLAAALFSTTLQGKKIAEFHELKKPKTLTMDQSQLYITEDAAIFIYSLKGFKLLKRFGRKGQGPQEFQTLPHIPVAVDVSTDKLIAFSMRKISYFTKKGEFINELRAVNQALKLQCFGNRFVGWSQMRDKGVLFSTINVFDAKLNKLQELFRMEDSFQGRGSGYKVLHKVFSYCTYDDKVLVPGEDDASIDVLDKTLKKVLTIRLDQERVKVDPAMKKRVINYFETSSETKGIYPMLKPLVFPNYVPVIADFFVDETDNGTVYVMTWKRENGANEFFTYDMNGKFKKRLMIPIRYETDLSAYPVIVKKGILYQLVDNENSEIWELHAEKIK